MALDMSPRMLSGKKERSGLKFFNPFRETCVGKSSAVVVKSSMRGVEVPEKS